MIIKKINFNFDVCISICVTILILLGISLLRNNIIKNNMLIVKILFNLTISFIMLYFSSKIKLNTYEYFAYLFYIINIFLISILFIFGKCSNGALRWLNLGIIKFQVSELSKISIPLIISSISYRYKNINSFKLISICLLLIFIPAILIAMQPDLGTSILIIISGLLTLFFSGISIKNIFLTNIFLVFLSFIKWKFFIREYQKNRILVLFGIKSDPLGISYNISQSKIAIGSGGLLGKGFLKNTQAKLNFIPESHTDFIFSILAEELGLLGVIFVIFIYSLIVIRGLLISNKSRDIFSKIFGSSLISSVFICMFINIGMVSGILPVVGVPLPFLSYGGSSLVILLIKLGIIMSINNENKILYF